MTKANLAEESQESKHCVCVYVVHVCFSGVASHTCTNISHSSVASVLPAMQSHSTDL